MIEVTSRTTIVLAAALFMAAPTLAMAQSTTVGGNTVTENNGAPGAPPSFPLESSSAVGPSVSGVGQSFYGVGVGNGFAGATVGTNNNGQIRAYSVGTQAPGEVCVLEPGTDIPYDCPNN